MSTLVVDLSSVVHTARWIDKGNDFSIPLVIHNSIDAILNNALLYKVKDIFIAVDGRDYWRRDLYPEYKAGRPRDERYEDMKVVFSEVKRFFSEFTKIPVCEVYKCEADDIIARFVHTHENVVILSSDKDFVQLLRDDVRLIGCTKNTKERFSDNPELDLFIKIIRGDAGDNIKSAYPRVRTTTV